ncbi:MAG: SDR family oxidoreductase [Candidatus Omnitrophota bacterium]
MSEIKRNVFLTGGTGLVGSYLLKLLLMHQCNVYLLVRSNNKKLPESRVKNVLSFWGVKSSLRRKIKILNGDMTKDSLGLSKKSLAYLKTNIDEIIHCAALTRFNSELDDLRSVNVEGTRRMCNLGIKWSREGRLKKIDYLSTVYICGNYKDIFTENDLALGQTFFTPYEQSKFEAEVLIHEYRKKIWIDIFRPPTVSGEFRTGKILSFNQALYQALHILNLELFDYLPGEKNYPFKLVFINDLCESIVKVALNTSRVNQTYHIFNEQCLTLDEMIKIACLFLNVRRPKLISPFLFNKKTTSAQRGLIKYNLMFLNTKAQLSSNLTFGILKAFNFSFNPINKSSILRSIEYAASVGFVKKLKKK